MPARLTRLSHEKNSSWFCVLLVAATLFGFQVARWTRSDRLPEADFPWWPLNVASHFTVLGLWTASWLLFWRHTLLPTLKGFGRDACPAPDRFQGTFVNMTVGTADDLPQTAARSQLTSALQPGPSVACALGFSALTLRHRGFALGVPVFAAVAAELLQRFLPGHVPDLLGFGCNLAGVGIGVLLCRSQLRR